MRRYFGATFEIYPYCINAEPAYFGTSKLLWRSAMLAFKLMPQRFGAILLVFMKKRETHSKENLPERPSVNVGASSAISDCREKVEFEESNCETSNDVGR
jgi:hypothetical protein